MSYSAFGQTVIPGLTLPGELPTGQLNVPLPGGGTYTVGGSQAQPEPPKPKEPSESAIKWTELAAGAVGVVVGLATLYAMVHQRKSYKRNARGLRMRWNISVGIASLLDRLASGPEDGLNIWSERISLDRAKEAERLGFARLGANDRLVITAAGHEALMGAARMTRDFWKGVR